MPIPPRLIKITSLADFIAKDTFPATFKIFTYSELTQKMCFNMFKLKKNISIAITHCKLLFFRIIQSQESRDMVNTISPVDLKW